MARPINIQLWDDTDGTIRVRIKAGNGRILFSSEAYEGGQDKAEHAIHVLVENIQDGNFKITTPNR